MTGKLRGRQSLATGFRSVDTFGDTEACTRCLDLIAGVPFFREVKRDSIRIVAGKHPLRVLDAGCGAGADLAALALALPAPAGIVGLDASASLLARASERVAASGTRCSLVRGDLLRIPFHDGTFGACRIDRVLQHIREPERAVRELVRILAPGGTLVAFDNDWDSYTISLGDQAIADRIRCSWRDRFASGRIGRDLDRIFETCGLEEICSQKRNLVLHDLPTAEQVFDLPHLLEQMAEGGELRRDEADAVRTEIVQRSQSGSFSAGYTGYLVYGQKPEG
jgi:SAM-dependent methyltransferase